MSYSALCLMCIPKIDTSVVFIVNWFVTPINCCFIGLLGGVAVENVSIDSEFINVTWNPPPSLNGLSMWFIVEIDHTSLEFNVTQNFVSVPTRTLTSDRDYNWTITSYNPVGRGNSTSVLTSLLSPSTGISNSLSTRNPKGTDSAVIAAGSTLGELILWSILRSS